MSIKEIAKKAGVSPATVSRVLNNPDYHCSSEQIRERVWQAAMECNYVPNEAARNLKLGIAHKQEKTYYINVLMTRTNSSQTDPFFSELLHVIESEIHKHLCILAKVWYMPVFSNDKKCKSSDLKQIVSELYDEVEGRADGLIIIGKCNKQALREWQKKYKSIVSVNRNSTNYEVDEVLCNGRKVAVQALEYLLRLGHRKIGYVGDCQNEARYQGFLDVIDQNDIELEPDYVVETNQTEAEGFDAMYKILQSEHRPTGIYCANDITAIGMIKCLSKYHLRSYHPSIIASDDIEEAQNTNPMLTTVRLPKDEMGKFAMYLLLDRMRGNHKSVARIELEGELMIRNSCFPAEESRI